MSRDIPDGRTCIQGLGRRFFWTMPSRRTSVSKALRPQPGQDLYVDAAGKAVVGEVGLPQLIGLLAWRRTYDERGRFY
jgi:hypothetical protein